MKKWFRQSVFYKWWSLFLTRFGDIMMATEPPKVKACHLRELMKVIQRGDVICRKYTYYLDSHFIKGAYSHSGFCLSSEEMIHAIAEGVGKIDVLDFTKDSDGFIILRPTYKSEDHLRRACAFALEQDGKPYDFLFDKKEKSAFYCHELTYNILNIAEIVILPKDKVIYADDIISRCTIIYETKT